MLPEQEQSAWDTNQDLREKVSSECTLTAITGMIAETFIIAGAHEMYDVFPRAMMDGMAIGFDVINLRNDEQAIHKVLMQRRAESAIKKMFGPFWSMATKTGQRDQGIVKCLERIAADPEGTMQSEDRNAVSVFSTSYSAMYFLVEKNFGYVKTRREDIDRVFVDPALKRLNLWAHINPEELRKYKEHIKARDQQKTLQNQSALPPQPQYQQPAQGGFGPARFGLPSHGFGSPPSGGGFGPPPSGGAASGGFVQPANPSQPTFTNPSTEKNLDGFRNPPGSGFSTPWR
ncbi:hypothetical protein A4U49_04300 [Acidithiobacillus ferrivorans]|jgi:hypothetical protein|uniref:hypothetical protein n=1 Tax=Acidithiobacillus ferrivorans TaxID=160808 RepID=UPI000892D1E8|nr:hypothetical protein [Acidithiobacillus ferrivorans]OFA17008.1 hypothetical protein A4U49_04300 [Acidithiobacillus ferrivorans]